MFRKGAPCCFVLAVAAASCRNLVYSPGGRMTSPNPFPCFISSDALTRASLPAVVASATSAPAVARGERVKKRDHGNRPLEVSLTSAGWPKTLSAYRPNTLDPSLHTDQTERHLSLLCLRRDSWRRVNSRGETAKRTSASPLSI